MRNIKNLIIPMLVEAYASGTIRTTRKEVPRISPNYKTAMSNSVLGCRNTPGVTERMDALEPGVHLHFILPDAFTHSQDGETYPDVPNRYIVTRVWFDEQIDRLNTRCFLVESDFISIEKKYSSSVTIPFFQDPDERKKWRYLGRNYPADQIPDDVNPQNYLNGLTCVGAGDMLFASYYPSCRSVFGFYDDLKDLPAAASRKLTYYVMGYFSNNTPDPFAQVTDRPGFKKMLAQYQFSVSPGSEICNRCVLYGMIEGLEWKGFEAEYCPVPGGKVNAAVGNTSAEALSCAIKKKIGEEISPSERMLTALQYELYDEANRLDGNFKIDDEIHLNTFLGVDGFDEVPVLSYAKERMPEEDMWDAYSRLKILGREIGQLRRLQQHDRGILSCVWEQYILLYEAEVESGDGKIPSKEALLTELETVCKRIESRKTEIEQKKQAYDRQRLALSESLPENDSCDPGGTESFYEPKEPVLLLSGPGIKRSFAFGEDGRFTNDGTLFCQTETMRTEAGRQEVFERCFDGLEYLKNFLPVYEELLFQTVLLTSDLKAFVERVLGELKIKGESPCGVAVNQTPFIWTTLYMMWGADYRPTRTEEQEDNTLADWGFEYGDTNLMYKGRLAPGQLKAHTISGRILLTPHAVTAFSRVVDRYADIYGEGEELKSLAKKIKDFPIISQNLSGFTSYFSGMWQALQFPVMGIGQDEQITKQVAKNLEDERLSILPESGLLPMRGGYVKMTNLALVSSFGQVQRLIEESYYNGCEVDFAETLKCPVKDYGLLPPAFSTPVRLNAAFVSSTNQTEAASAKQVNSPVCGIVIPEMLNRRLLAYTADGIYLGMIKTVYRSKKAEARWLSAPGLDPDFQKLIIPDKIFQSFLYQLLSGEHAFYEFNCLMDQYLAKKQDFGTLVWGRPLALARMSAELEFCGLPQVSKKYEDFRKNNTCQAEKIRFALKFGDMERVTDGLLGYFDDVDFKKMYPAFGASDGQIGQRYVTYSESIYISSTDKVRFFTVLMEPDSPMHLQSGLLPVKTIHLEPEHTNTAKTLPLSAEISPILAASGQVELPPLPKPEEGSTYKWYVLDHENYVDNEMMEPIVSFENTILMDGFLVKEGKNESGHNC